MRIKLNLSFYSKEIFKDRKYTATNVSLWFETNKEKWIQDIKLLCPYSVKDRQFLDFQIQQKVPFCVFTKAEK